MAQTQQEDPSVRVFARCSQRCFLMHHTTALESMKLAETEHGSPGRCRAGQLLKVRYFLERGLLLLKAVLPFSGILGSNMNQSFDYSGPPATHPSKDSVM